jgi:cytochrome c peroxidase
LSVRYGVLGAWFYAIWCGFLCTTASAAGVLDFSASERAQIIAHGPWPPARASDASNRAVQHQPAITFGRQLFFDKTLSARRDQSCATCHQPQRAFQDGLATAKGNGTRNTPGLLDAAQRRWLGWGGAHDSVWAASLSPLLAAGEMGQRIDSLAALVRKRPDLQRGYQKAFGAIVLPSADDETVVVNLAKALAAYQATLTSPRTAFDDFRDALLANNMRAAARYPLAAQRGLRLFVGRASCSVCHAGPQFSNGEFADIGVPFFVRGGVDAGRHSGLQQLQSSRFNRLGPHNDSTHNDGRPSDPQAVTTQHVTIEPRHFGEFRVPGLRQLQHTAPYMHNGSISTLLGVVQHYSDLNEERLHADGERILKPLKLTAQEQADLLAFLRSLGGLGTPPTTRPR